MIRQKAPLRAGLTIFLLAAILLKTVAQQNLPDSVAVAIKKSLTSFQTTNHIPGLSFALVSGDKIIYSEAAGLMNTTTGIPVSADSRFPIMSVTKTFVATMFMQLVEKGIVSPEDPVAKYLHEYKITSGYRATTLLQLATHNSGLPRNPPPDIGFLQSVDRWMLTGSKDSVETFPTNQQVLASLQYLEPDYLPYDFIHPNDRHYSNLAYALLGMALEKASGTSFQQYVSKNIFAPLKMTSSGFLTEAGIENKIATGYRYDMVSKSFISAPFYPVNYAVYPGGIYATAGDLALYLAGHYLNNNMLTADSKARMQTQKIGWKPAYPFVLHEGGFPGYRSIVVFNPHAQIGWVVLTNCNDVDFNALNNQLADLTKTLGVKFEKPNQSQLAGRYKLPGRSESISITIKNDSLYSDYMQHMLPSNVLIPDGNLRYKAVGPNGYSIGYEFAGEKNQPVNRFRMGQLVWYKQ